MKSYRLLLLLCCLLPGCVTAATLPTTLYEEWRKSPAPADGSVALMNPPSLQWASVKHWEGRNVRYRVELSEDASFPPDKTERGPVQRWCFYNHHAKLKSGKWYWRYEILDGTKTVTRGPYSFVIESATQVFETPTFSEFMARVPKTHPRVVTQGHDLAAIRRFAATNPLAGDILKAGKKAAAARIYDGPVSGGDPAEERALSRTVSREVQAFHQLVKAYILSGDKTMGAVIVKRINVMLQWPTNNLVGSQVLSALSEAYDALFDELPAEVRTRMLAVIEKQLRQGLSAWPGNIEGRQVENHFWQVELAANFTAALATFGDLEVSREMLEYTYELFLARFPNLATPGGGWAEGLGYFGVNQSCVVDMAVLLKKIGQADVFKMPWYQSLPDYFIYFAPINGRIDGFGDMHDRVGNGNIGRAMMLVLGEENDDPKARFRAASLMQDDSNMEAWYQMVNGINFDPSRAVRPTNLPEARMFRGVGLAAMHTDVLNSSNDTAVYFRSSPFGAKGHMHANQNAFNLSRRGEPLFYSTGYYTSFADPHSMSSYRNTRAHNTILVNGCGQAFGHEGYGWIKRYANSENMSYVCGDATMAYRQTVDRQFLDMLKESKIAPTRENGCGDSKLKLFERHLLFIRPNTIIIYDVLESEVESDWTLLLHTMKKPEIDNNGLLVLATEKNRATGFVAGSGPLHPSMTDQFWSPPVDIRKKYNKMPAQYHINYTSKEKSRAMRFLTILQTANPGEKIPAVVTGENGNFTIGDIRLHVELAPNRPACLSVDQDSAKFYLNRLPNEVFGQNVSPPVLPSTMLAEKHDGKVSVIISEDMPPEY